MRKLHHLGDEVERCKRVGLDTPKIICPYLCPSRSSFQTVGISVSKSHAKHRHPSEPRSSHIAVVSSQVTDWRKL